MSATPAQDFDTVVMKFGGSSVADAEKVRRVARRLVAAKERGLRVVRLARGRRSLPAAALNGFRHGPAMIQGASSKKQS